MSARSIPMAHLLASSACTGFAVMGAEVAASRLLAPYFGTSTPVWSALIGVVLGALALGARLGGRASRGPHALRRIYAAVAAAGALLVILPFAARPLMRHALASFFHGSVFATFAGLTAVLLMLALPVVLVGMMGPVLVHAAADSREDVGTAAARLSAYGTLGSLAGTFTCGLFAVPVLGTEATFRICGVLCAVIGASGLFHRARVRSTAAVATTVVAALVIPRGSIRSGVSPVYEAETPYNYLRVEDRQQERVLSLNEGYAVQSVQRHDGRAYLEGVWGYYALAPAFASHPPSRILVVGLGGGTSARYFAERYPDAEVVALELDPGVVSVARTHFGLPSRVTVHIEDARAHLERDDSHYDVMIVDAFQFPYAPFQLATRELYALLHGKLSPGGAVMVNAGRKGPHLDVVHAVAKTLGTAFAHVNGVNVPHTTNSILVGTDHPLERARGVEDLSLPPWDLSQLMRLPRLHRWDTPAGTPVLDDDRAPIEWLTHRIIARELVLMAQKSS